MTGLGLLVALLCVASWSGAWAAGQGDPLPAGGARRVEFDIPALPLNTALDRFASASGWPILFHSRQVAGRMSSPVSGVLPPAVALRRLLGGTGLVAEREDAGPVDAYVLRESSPSAIEPAGEAHGVDFGYGGGVQSAVWRALCAQARTAPGDYRALIRVWVGADGQVRDADLIGSTGEARRDASVLQVVKRVRVAEKPPLGLAQPLVFLILPQAHSGTRCDAAAGATP